MCEPRKMVCKRQFLIKGTKLQVPKVDVTPLDGFDFAEALASVYPVLEMVFDYLDCNDLKTCSKVNESWRRVAEKMLGKQNKSGWFTCYRKGFYDYKRKERIFTRSSNLKYNNADICIIFYYGTILCPRSCACVNYNMKQTKKTVSRYLEEEVVPRYTKYCMIPCRKVMAYFNGFQLKSPFNSVMDGLILPKIPNIRTTMVYCDPMKRNFQKFVDPHIKENEEVKCALVFTRSTSIGMANFIKYLISKNDAASVALGGAVLKLGMEAFQEFTPRDGYPTCSSTFCILFLQERGSEADFNAFSLVIDGQDLFSKSYEEKLLEFKQQVVLRANTVAFIMSTRSFDGEELKAISKIFPNTPLLGMKVNMVLGGNCSLKPEKDENGEYQTVKHPLMSTVIVLITWGPLPSE